MVIIWEIFKSILKTRIPMIIVVIIIVMFTLGGFYIMLNGKKDTQRVRDSFSSALKDSVEKYKTKSGLVAYKSDQQELTKKEVNDIYPDLVKEINDMKIRLHNVESVDRTYTTNTTNITTTVRKDSVVVDRIKYAPIDYQDSFNIVHGLLRDTTLKLAISHKEMLTIVPYFERKKVLWILPIGRKLYKVAIKSSDPNTIVNYNQYINIK